LAKGWDLPGGLGGVGPPLCGGPTPHFHLQERGGGSKFDPPYAVIPLKVVLSWKHKALNTK